MSETERPELIISPADLRQIARDLEDAHCVSVYDVEGNLVIDIYHEDWPGGRPGAPIVKVGGRA